MVNVTKGILVECDPAMKQVRPRWRHVSSP